MNSDDEVPADAAVHAASVAHAPLGLFKDMFRQTGERSHLSVLKADTQETRGKLMTP